MPWPLCYHDLVFVAQGDSKASEANRFRKWISLLQISVLANLGLSFLD